MRHAFNRETWIT